METPKLDPITVEREPELRRERMSECDCKVFPVKYHINHRGETMQATRPRSRSYGPRTRGLGETRSSRDRSLEMASFDSSLLRERAPLMHTTNGLFEKTSMSLFDLQAYSGHRVPGLRVPSDSNLKDYVDYSRRSEPCVADVDKPFEAPVSGVDFERSQTLPAKFGSISRTRDETQEVVGCSRCRGLERENQMLRISNQSLKKQLQSRKLSMDALSKGDNDEFDDSLYQENSALNEEIESLKSLLDKTDGVPSTEKEAISHVRDTVFDYLQSDRGKRDKELEHYKDLVCELQEELDNQQNSNNVVLGAIEARLIEENARLLAIVSEQGHATELVQCSETELTTQNHNLKEQLSKLKAELGIIGEVLPNISENDSAMLLQTWSDVPDDIKESLELGSDLKELIGQQEGLEDNDEIIQCLWYRYKSAAKALSELQQELENIGITRTEQLPTLSEIDTLLIERDTRIKKLRDDLNTSEKGKTELVKEYSLKISEAINARNDFETKVSSLERQKRINVPIVDESSSHDIFQENLEQVLTELSTCYDIALFKEEMESLREENKKLKEQSGVNIGRPEVRDLSDIKKTDVGHWSEVTDIDQLRDLCEQLTHQRDHYQQQSQSMSQRGGTVEIQGVAENKQHIENLKEELRQASEDRKQLREQVSHFSTQITELSTKNQERLIEKDKDISRFRDELQEMLQEREALKQQLEKEKRNSADLKVTYHKEIKNHSTNSKQDFEKELEVLRKELTLSQKTSQNNESEKERLIEEVKLLTQKCKASEKRISAERQLTKRVSDKLSAHKELSESPDFQELMDTLRGMEDDSLTVDMMGEDIIEKKVYRGVSSANKVNLGESGHEQIDFEESSRRSEAHMDRENQQLQAAAVQTRQQSNDLMNKFKDLEGYSVIDSSGLKQSLTDLSSRFDIERNLLRSQRNRAIADLRSYQARIQVVEETKQQLKATCETLEKKLAALQAEYASLKNELGDGNQLTEEMETLKAKYTTVTINFKELRRRQKLEQNDVLQQLKSKDDAMNELQQHFDRLREKKEKLKEDHRQLSEECASLRTTLNDQKHTTSNEKINMERQLQTTKENLEELRKELKVKNKEVFDIQEKLLAAQTESKSMSLELRRTVEKLKGEEDMNGRLTARNSTLEEEFSTLKMQLSGYNGEKEMNSQSQRLIRELKDQIAQLKADLSTRDQDVKLKEQQIEWMKTHSSELENQLQHERSLTIASRSRLEAVEDEAEWLRTQLGAWKQKRAEGDHETKNRAEQINEIILRSQTRAQAMLATNPDLARSYSPHSHLFSPHVSEAGRDRLSVVGQTL